MRLVVCDGEVVDDGGERVPLHPSSAPSLMVRFVDWMDRQEFVVAQIVDGELVEAAPTQTVVEAFLGQESR